MRVLVADDNKEIRKALRLALLEVSTQEAAIADKGDISTAACTIFEATDAGEALKVIDQESIDLALVDSELPGLDGARALSRIKIRSPECKVIAMSGRPEARTSSIRSGADYFVGKSDPPHGLMNLLGDLWRAQRA